MEANQSKKQTSKLQQIRGIGPAVASRLAEAGIDGVEALAAAPLERVESALQGLPVMSQERILEWIAAASVLAAPPKEVTAENGQHYATFKLELLRGQDNEVRRTRISHVQSGRKDIWPGWEVDRVEKFVMETIETQSPEAGELKADADQAEEEPLVALQGDILEPVRLHNLRFITTEGGGSPLLVHRNEPFDVRFDVKTEGVSSGGLARLLTTLYVRPIGETGRRQLIQNVATRPVGSNLEIEIGAVAGPEIDPGAYRLEVELDVEEGTRRWPTASLSEGMMLVY